MFTQNILALRSGCVNSSMLSVHADRLLTAHLGVSSKLGTIRFKHKMLLKRKGCHLA